VQHEPQIVFNADRDALTDTLQFPNTFAFDCGQWRIYRAQKERAGHPNMLDRFSNYAWLQCGYVSRDVWQFGHEYSLPRSWNFGKSSGLHAPIMAPFAKRVPSLHDWGNRPIFPAGVFL
jgi:hypothetical protein